MLIIVKSSCSHELANKLGKVPPRNRESLSGSIDTKRLPLANRRESRAKRHREKRMRYRACSSEDK